MLYTLDRGLARQADTLALVARLCLGVLFLWSGLGKFADLGMTAGFITQAGMPFPPLLAPASACLEVGGALLLFAGLASRPVALALAAFTVATMFLFHAFWTYPPEAVQAQQTNFYKNLSIAGGLLLVAAFGPGALSAETRLSRGRRSERTSS